jgi:hypothetical protein
MQVKITFFKNKYQFNRLVERTSSESFHKL